MTSLASTRLQRLALTLLLLGGGGQATADPIPRSDVDWADSGDYWTEINRVQPGSMTPYITFSRQIQNDPEGRLWHAQTSWWDGTAWQTAEIVRGLLENPWATAHAEMEQGVQHDLVHAWRNVDEINWRAMNPTTGMMVGAFESFDAPHRQYPIGLDIRTDGLPVFTYFVDPDGPGGPEPSGMYYARWNDQLNKVVDHVHLESCADARTPLDLRADDEFIIACATPPIGGATDIMLGFRDAMGVYQEETVFGAADNHAWLGQDIAIADDTVVVAAYNLTTSTVWARIKDGNAAWQGPVKLIELDPFDDGFLVSLSVEARKTVEGLIYGVLVATSRHQIYYGERRADGTVPEVAQAELHPPSAGCDSIRNNVDLHFADDDTAWLNWQIEHVNGAGANVVADRFTAFRREDQRDFQNMNNLQVMPYRPTTLNLDEAGDGWRCFYDEDPGGPPKVALFIQHRDDTPILVEGDTGAVGGAFGRGCDVAVDEDGDVHIVWNSTTLNRMRSAWFDGVGFSAFLSLSDSHGVIPPTAEVALAVSHDGRTSTVYQRPVGGNQRACVLDTIDQVNYVTTCFAQNGGGINPDITLLGQWGYVRALIYGTSSDVRVAITNAFPGGWADEQASGDDVSIDHGIAGRTTNADSRLYASWATLVDPKVRLAERVVPVPPLLPFWDVATLEAGSAEYTSIEVDPRFQPVVTWKRNGVNETLRVASFQDFADGRAAPAAVPTGRFVLCDLDDSLFGNALELDEHGNPRVSFRSEGKETSLPTNALYFISRP